MFELKVGDVIRWRKEIFAHEVTGILDDKDLFTRHVYTGVEYRKRLDFRSIHWIARTTPEGLVQVWPEVKG